MTPHRMTPHPWPRGICPSSARRTFVGALLGAALAAAAAPAAIAAAPVTIGGPFTLVAPDGSAVSERTYAGKWLLVYFGYTYCPSTCPTALMDIANALKKLGADASKVQPLFITVDPARDTPSAMGQYTAEFDRRIVGLSGNPLQIATVAKEYGAYYARHNTGPGPDDYVMDHGTYIYLMDPAGTFVRGFAAAASGDEIAHGVRQAMARAGHGMSRSEGAAAAVR